MRNLVIRGREVRTVVINYRGGYPVRERHRARHRRYVFRIRVRIAEGPREAVVVFFAQRGRDAERLGIITLDVAENEVRREAAATRAEPGTDGIFGTSGP